VFNVGPAELMIIFVLALLVFGPKRLPEMSRQLGKGIREFRRVSDEVRGEVEHAMTLDDNEPEIVSLPEQSPNGNASASANGETTGAADLAEEQPPPERTD
jgi:TatA/E family protein of Tat protein translocase